jgi:formylglycine-generating enzyme required for sulfatase activity
VPLDARSKWSLVACGVLGVGGIAYTIARGDDTQGADEDDGPEPLGSVEAPAGALPSAEVSPSAGAVAAAAPVDPTAELGGGPDLGNTDDGDADDPSKPDGSAPQGMVWVPGGEFMMGSDYEHAWPNEKPAHRVRVRGFWLDEAEVTNARFRDFVRATQHVTTAETAPSLEDIMRESPAGTPPPPEEMLVAGSLVFRPPKGPVDLGDYTAWWAYVEGATWEHPEGPKSNLTGKDAHPVVHVTWEDADAFCKWEGKRLPTEAEWERAARGGQEARIYVWGDEPQTDQHIHANIWQGDFPSKNTAKDGYERTAPVKSYAPNAYKLYDMAGNVWEWCADEYEETLYGRRVGHGVIDQPFIKPRKSEYGKPAERVQRGGSFLCNDSYCSRYRPSARQGVTPTTSSSHAGFRCAR